jgi:hypothetical protein
MSSPNASPIQVGHTSKIHAQQLEREDTKYIGIKPMTISEEQDGKA